MMDLKCIEKDGDRTATNRLLEIASPIFEALAAEAVGFRSEACSYCCSSPKRDLFTERYGVRLTQIFCRREGGRLMEVVRAVRNEAIRMGQKAIAAKNGVYDILDRLLVRWAAQEIESLDWDALSLVLEEGRSLGVHALLSEEALPSRDEVVLKTVGLLETMARVAGPAAEGRFGFANPCSSACRSRCLERLLAPTLLKARGTESLRQAVRLTDPCCLLLARAGHDFGPLDSVPGRIWLEPACPESEASLLEKIAADIGDCRALPKHVVEDDRFLGLKDGIAAWNAWAAGLVPEERVRPWWGVKKYRHHGPTLLYEICRKGFVPPEENWLDSGSDSYDPVLCAILGKHPNLVPPERTDLLRANGWKPLQKAIAMQGASGAAPYLHRVLDVLPETGSDRREAFREIGNALVRMMGWGWDDILSSAGATAAFWDRAAAEGLDIDLQDTAIEHARSLAKELGWRPHEGIEFRRRILEHAVAVMTRKDLHSFLDTARGAGAVAHLTGIEGRDACRDWAYGLRKRREMERGFDPAAPLPDDPEPFL